VKSNPYIFTRPKETQPKNLTAPRTKLKRAPELLESWNCPLCNQSNWRLLPGRGWRAANLTTPTNHTKNAAELYISLVLWWTGGSLYYCGSVSRFSISSGTGSKQIGIWKQANRQERQIFSSSFTTYWAGLQKGSDKEELEEGAEALKKTALHFHPQAPGGWCRRGAFTVKHPENRWREDVRAASACDASSQSAAFVCVVLRGSLLSACSVVPFAQSW